MSDKEQPTDGQAIDAVLGNVVRQATATLAHTTLPTIHARDVVWEESGPEEDPRGRLRCSIEICGCLMHLEAWAVEYDQPPAPGKLGVHQQAAVWTEDFDPLYNLAGVSAFRTVEIKDRDLDVGREYILLATPGEL